MNIFEKIRIKKLLKMAYGSFKKKYYESPEIIKSDFSIINCILLKNMHISIDYNYLKSFILDQPDMINYVFVDIHISKEEFIKIFDDINNLIFYLTDKDLIFLLASSSNIIISKEQFMLLDYTKKIILINQNISYFNLNVDDNKKLISLLNKNIQIELMEKDNDLFEYLSDDIKVELAKNNINLFHLINPDLQLKILFIDNSRLEWVKNMDVLKEYINNIEKLNLDSTQISNLYCLYKAGLRSPHYIKELLRIRLKGKKDLYNVIQEEFKYVDDWRLLNFFNDDILKNNSEEVLWDYFSNPSVEKLKNILENVYGEHIENIFEQRHLKNIDNIDDPLIFHKKIYDNFGIKFIKQVLNYEIPNLSLFLFLILNNGKVFNNYKKIYNYMTNQIGDGIEVFNLAIQKTINICELLKQYDFDELLNNYSSELNFMLFNENMNINVDSLEKLKNINNSLLINNLNNGYINHNFESQHTNHFLFKYYTGLVGNSRWTFKCILNYDLSDYFTKEEIETINIIYIISDIPIYEDKHNQKIMELLNQYPDRFNPLRLHKLFNKINEYYRIGYKTECTDNQKIQEESIGSESEDGIEVINFKGEPFNFIASGVNGYSQSKGNDPYENLSPSDLVQKWLYYEGGQSTISASINSNGYAPALNNSNLYTDFFGFTGLNADQITEFFDKDVGTAHRKRELSPNRYFYCSYEDVKYWSYENKPYLNETVIKRYDKDGNRLVPDFIVVNADDIGQFERAKEIVKAFKKHGYNVKIYRIFLQFYKNQAFYQPAFSKNSIVHTELTDKIDQIINRREVMSL